MNQVKISGKLAFQPELKYSSAGKAYMSNKLAVKRGKTEETDYIPIKLFGDNAKLVGNMKKGDWIEVEGSMQSGSYEKEGQKLYTLDCIVWSVNP